MNANDKIILGQILDQQRSERAPTSSKSEFFELFVAEQALKDHDLAYDELEAGLLGSGGDGGIDAMYILVNGEMAQEDIDLAMLKKNVLIEVVIIQAKLSEGFKESAIEKLTAASEDIFDLGKDLKSFESVYNQGLRSAAEIFRTVYKGLAAKFPTLRFRFVYATTGSEVHPNVNRKAELMGGKVQSFFSNAEYRFEFLGASELLSLARRQPPVSHELALAETPISSAGDVGYICLVKLRDYDKFIRDGDGQLRRNLFESNVRDYQGSTAVNEEIGQSLRVTGGEDFWWLNNGITIVAGKATQSGKALTLEDPQIVNGLQTSTEIFRYFSEVNTDKDERNVLVRVIVPRKAESRDRVIKATNSQTSIPPASLRATDKIHRDIEEYLRSFGLYYDRRKNNHKNEGRPLEKIVGIPLMAQAIMAVMLQRPDDARARPSSLLKKDSDYELVFSTKLPIEIYRVSASIVKKVDAFLRSGTDLGARERNNLRFYVAMHVAAIQVGKSAPSSLELASMDVDKITDEIIRASFDIIQAAYDALGGGDHVAKGTSLVESVRRDLTDTLG
ncbi:AIPR family protein [Burkholderia stagnalis]|uniref:AIPR family protein n=1 Tax=Burkholderia stagnalis TaxID=1503054 RepID=UPI00076008C7|nr:AIPR family protein [Burkholderia stagnalis]KWN68480.1 hypothetical protein WT90_26130 [Burkholderia stagnalis]